MAQQEDGWPLGLQPLNVRVRVARPSSSNHDHSGAVSFNTMLTASPSSSSDLDTEGLVPMTIAVHLGSLIGVSSILDLSKRSVRGKKAQQQEVESLGLFVMFESDNMIDVPSSLGHFLAAGRRAAGGCSGNHSLQTCDL